MLIRFCLFVAIVAALAAGGINFSFEQGKIKTLMQQRDGYHSERDQTQSQLDKTKKDYAKSQESLKQAQQGLADAQAAEKKAEDTAAAQIKRADEVADKLAKAAQERDEAQGELSAYKATDFTPKQVADMGRSLKDAQTAIEALNDEKAVLNRAISQLKNRLARYEGTNQPVELSASLRGKILVVDPKWDFVVLDIGGDQGVLENGELLVSRDGKLVAKVVVRSVLKDRCIANMVPGWKLGEVFEGDEVTPAHPAS